MPVVCGKGENIGGRVARQSYVCGAGRGQLAAGMAVDVWVLTEGQEG